MKEKCSIRIRERERECVCVCVFWPISYKNLIIMIRRLVYIYKKIKF